MHTMSETRMLGSKRNVVSPSKVYATELTQVGHRDNSPSSSICEAQRLKPQHIN